jgi:hypothetical protein
MLQLVQQAMISAGVTTATMAQPSGMDVLAPVGKQEEDKKPILGLREAAGGPVTAQPAAMIQLQDYQRFISMNMVAPVYTMKVEEAVELVKVNFESKSIEITGEVPMTKLDAENTSPDKLAGLRDSSRDEDFRGGLKPPVSDAAKSAEGDSEKPGDGHDKMDVDVVEVALATTIGVPDKGPEALDKAKDVDNPLPSVLLGGHSSADLMSAELLLSLTRNSSKDWPSSLKKATPLTASANDSAALSSPAHSGPHTPSSGRKRKQKPIASAKPQGNDKNDVTPTKRRRVRKLKDGAEGGGPKGSEAGKKSLQQVTPEELLQILNITPAKPEGVKGQVKAKGKSAKDSMESESLVSKASAKMEQLKASRAVKPMKEYVIETDSDSNSSSSTSSSSRFTPNSGSSSDSSSDSSSNDDSSEPRVKTPVKASTGRGRGRGRGKGRKAEQRGDSSSDDDDDSSSDDDDDDIDGKKVKGMVSQRGRGKLTKRGGGMVGRSRGRGGGVSRGDPLRGEHVVSIPTRLLKNRKLKPPPEVCQLV